MKENIEGHVALEYLSASSGLTLKEKKGSGGWTQILSPCPACGHKGLYYFDSTGVFKCQHAGCQFNDKAANAVDFVIAVTGQDFKTASQGLIAAAGGKRAEFISAAKVREKVQKELEEPDKLSPSERNESYQELKRHMVLKANDKADLTKRGLSEKEINILGYKTAHFGNPKMVMLDVKKKEGLPGAYKDNDGQWTFVQKYPCKKEEAKNVSYLIWCRDINGNIVGAQVSTGDPDKKYTWLSSASYDCGTVQKSRMHYAISHIYDWKTEESEPVIGDTVYLIEGLLKGDICHLKTGKPFICLAGVSQYSALETELPALKKAGVKKVNICYDMDYHINEGVKKAIRRVMRILLAAGFETKQLEWDKAYKGLDDYLVANPNQTLIV